MSTVDTGPIVVTIPVYRDVEVTRRCIESVLASELPDAARIVVINDATPDDELRDYLASLDGDTAIDVLHNDENRGFVATANRGLQLALEAQADAVLLNSDTRVPAGWLQRLQRCVRDAGDIGTATPFSNNATICSYPGFLDNNTLPEDSDAITLDRLFQQANSGESADIPTAVGFCMYIRYDCLQQVGLFDEDNFGQGYGEECDFSMRAQNSGWRNIVAADVFVFHEGAVSFQGEASSRKNDADQVMDSLHPDYSAQVEAFAHQDPLLEFRNRVSTLRLRQQAAAADALLEEQFRQARQSVKRSSRTQRELQETRAKLHDALEHNAWYEKEQERLHAEAFEGREYRRLYEEAQAQMKRTDEGIRELEELLESREARLGEALEKASWLEKELGETYQLAVWRQKELEKKYQELDRVARSRAELEQNLVQAEQLIEQVRGEFQRTDEALGAAQSQVGQLQQSLETTSAVLADTQEALEQTGQRLADAEAELLLIKSSRSWRYTAWLRKQEV